MSFCGIYQICCRIYFVEIDDLLGVVFLCIFVSRVQKCPCMRFYLLFHSWIWVDRKNGSETILGGNNAFLQFLLGIILMDCSRISC